MNKNIWIYWNSGFDNAPSITRECLKSWKYYNPNYNINVLSDENVYDYVPKTLPRRGSGAAWSDTLRINLINKHGGLWVDATTFCNKPLDDWFEPHSKNGFFAFSDATPVLKICSWFLYSEKNGYISNMYKRIVDDYWVDREKPHDYFWFHLIFNQIYKIDPEVKNLWDSTLKYKANWQPPAETGSNPCYFAPYNAHRFNQLKKPLDAPVYKLSWKANDALMNNNLIKDLLKDIS